MFMDPEGTIIDCNRRLCEMLGTKPERVANVLRSYGVID